MTQNLKRLLDRIDPDGDELLGIDRQVDLALSTFLVRSGDIRSQEDFEECLAVFVFRATLPKSVQQRFERMPQRHWRRRAAELVDRAFPGGGAEKAYRMTRESMGGGINAVLKQVGQRLKEELQETYVSSQIAEYWDSLSVAQRLSAPGEYVAQCGCLLPACFRDGSTSPLLIGFPDILQHHPGWVRIARRALAQT
mgnify:CR=1 FL=1